MSLFNLFSKKNPYEVNLATCLREAAPEVLVPYVRLFRKDATSYDPALDLPQLLEYLSRDDLGLLQTAATVPGSSWKVFRELITNGGRVVTLSMKNPEAFEKNMTAMGAFAHLPYFTCETPSMPSEMPLNDDLPDLTFKMAVAEEIRSTFNRHLKDLDRDYTAWTNLWTLAVALVRFAGVCPFDDFFALARDRFHLAIPAHVPSVAADARGWIISTIDERNTQEKGKLAVTGDAFVLPDLANLRGVADNIRQRRAAAFAAAPTGLDDFVKFTAEHALTDADLHLEDSDGKAVRTQMVGRNDPCPCGSGKKFKKCCGR